MECMFVFSQTLQFSMVCFRGFHPRGEIDVGWCMTIFFLLRLYKSRGCMWGDLVWGWSENGACGWDMRAKPPMRDWGQSLQWGSRGAAPGNKCSSFSWTYSLAWLMVSVFFLEYVRFCMSSSPFWIMPFFFWPPLIWSRLFSFLLISFYTGFLNASCPFGYADHYAFYVKAISDSVAVRCMKV